MKIHSLTMSELPGKEKWSYMYVDLQDDHDNNFHFM